MNKIININLAGRLIPMEEPAYEAIQEYLTSLMSFFSKEDGAEEIIHDMEDRIGELFQDKIKKGLAAITTKEVQEVKTIMGSPEEIANNEEEGNNENRKEEKSSGTENGSNPKHLSRSKNEKVIGGVCGGLAAYFNIDPVVVRALFVFVTIFWGSGLLIYIVLWALLPKQETTQVFIKRRWYRDTDKKVIAGVCSGIAGYFKIDPIWLRLIFISPIFLGFGFGIWSHFHIFSTGAFPSMILLYLILWIILPKAESLTEKLEASGKDVDLKNVSEAIKNEPKPQNQHRSGLASFIIVIFKIFMIFIGVIVLLVVLAIVVALLFALLGIGTASAYLLPFTSTTFGTPIQEFLLIVSIFLVVAIPVFLLIYFLIKILSGNKRSMPRWASITLIILFIGGIFGLSSIAGNVLLDFRYSSQQGQNVPLTEIKSDTLRINSQSMQQDVAAINSDALKLNFVEKNLSLDFEKSTDSVFHIILQKKARGRNFNRATINAKQIGYRINQMGNDIYLPEIFNLPLDAAYRAQRVKIIIQVPAGKYIRFNDSDLPWWNNNEIDLSDEYGGVIRYYGEHDQTYDDNGLYQMQADGHLQKE